MIQQEIVGMHWVQNDLNRGKGHALRTGVEVANSEYIIFTDVDFPYTEESMLDLIGQLLSGEYDAVIGTRDDSYYNSLPTSRKRISFLLKNLNARLLGLKIADTQGGLKGFTKKLKPVFLQTEIDRYLFDLEFIYLLSRNKSYRLLPLKVKLRDGVEFSKVRFGILFGEFKNFLKVWWSAR
jgi:glycosyltransferase involved in cell wall biosynthesis